MKILDFIESLKVDENLDNVKLLNKTLQTNIEENDVIALIQNMNENPVFFEDDIFYRLISFSELINAKEKLGFDVLGAGIVPLIDVSDNIFIGYDYKKKSWCKLDISEDVGFAYKQKLIDYFK